MNQLFRADYPLNSVVCIAWVNYQRNPFGITIWPVMFTPLDIRSAELSHVHCFCDNPDVILISEFY